MDKNRPTLGMQAPGAASSSSSYRLPGASSPLRVDDHVVEPESSRREVMVGGRIVQALPANAILTILEKRGLAPGADARSCLRTTLNRWLERALAAGSLADVFTEP